MLRDFRGSSGYIYSLSGHIAQFDNLMYSGANSNVVNITGTNNWLANITGSNAYISSGYFNTIDSTVLITGNNAYFSNNVSEVTGIFP